MTFGSGCKTHLVRPSVGRLAFYHADVRYDVSAIYLASPSGAGCSVFIISFYPRASLLYQFVHCLNS